MVVSVELPAAQTVWQWIRVGEECETLDWDCALLSGLLRCCCDWCCYCAGVYVWAVLCCDGMAATRMHFEANVESLGQCLEWWRDGWRVRGRVLKVMSCDCDQCSLFRICEGVALSNKLAPSAAGARPRPKGWDRAATQH
jgi:hypothetical protein